MCILTGLNELLWMRMELHAGFPISLTFWMPIGQLRTPTLDVRRYLRKHSTHTIGRTHLYSDPISVLNNKRGHYGPLSFLFTM